jgi:hypothetical protein
MFLSQLHAKVEIGLNLWRGHAEEASRAKAPGLRLAKAALPCVAK